MKRSIGSTIRRPPAVARALSRKVTAMVVWTALRSAASSWAPYRWEIITEAPVARPVQKPTTVLMIEPVEPTAACASLETKLPTTRVSTVL